MNRSRFVLIPFLLLTSLMFFSCSTEARRNKGTVSITIDEATVRIIREEVGLSYSPKRAANYNNVYIDIGLNGGYAESKTIPMESGVTATFEEIPTGVRVYAEATVYLLQQQQREVLYKGTSKKIMISDGTNPLNLVLEKVGNTSLLENDDDEEETFKITFRLDGGVWAAGYTKPARGTSGQTITLPTASNIERSGGWIFLGWKDEANNVMYETGVDETLEIEDSDISLTAVWNKVTIGIAIEVSELNDINVTSSENSDGSVITFTAEEGYTTYLWKVDGQSQSTTSRTFQFTVPELLGVYDITLLASKTETSGATTITTYRSYSAQVDVTQAESD